MKVAPERVNEVVDRLNSLFREQGKKIVASNFHDDIIKFDDENTSVLYQIIENEKSVSLKLIDEIIQ